MCGKPHGLNEAKAASSRQHAPKTGRMNFARHPCLPGSAVKGMTEVSLLNEDTWVVVKIMVPLGVPIIIRHLLFRVPQKGTLILTTTHIDP